MKNTLSIALVISFLSFPMSVHGQEIENGLDKLGEGGRLLLEGLLKKLDPMVHELGEKLGDLSAYYPPEVMPNGDIIIRRKVPLKGEQQGEIDL